jgi:hypothetical protein
MRGSGTASLTSMMPAKVVVRTVRRKKTRCFLHSRAVGRALLRRVSVTGESTNGGMAWIDSDTTNQMLDVGCQMLGKTDIQHLTSGICF